MTRLCNRAVSICPLLQMSGFGKAVRNIELRQCLLSDRTSPLYDRPLLVVTCRSQHQHERQLPLPLPTYKTLFVQFLSAKLRSSMGALMTTHRRCRTTNRTRSESRNWGHVGLSSAVASQCCFMEPTALTFLTWIVKYTPRRFNQATCRACNKF